MSTANPPLSATLPGTWELLSRIDVTDDGQRRVDPSQADRLAISLRTTAATGEAVTRTLIWRRIG